MSVPNGSFEMPMLQDWTPRAWAGPAPRVDLVRDVRKQGLQSLRLSASTPADFTVTQNIHVLSGSLWRLRTWVKTQDLQSTAAMQYGGTVQVRTIDNRTTLAEAPPQMGTSDWREVELAFRAPPEGQAMLSLVLVGYGRGTGTAWFDDVRLERVPPDQFEQKVLDFPIDWGQGGPYNKFLPTDAKGRHGGWSCSQVARAMILRYWSQQVNLRCGGTYFYYSRDGHRRVFADFNKPFQWNRMLPTLRGLRYEDPRVDPIADLVYRLCVGHRTDWPRSGDGLGFIYSRDIIEVLGKYFGFDLTQGRKIQVKPFIESGHTWGELAEIVRKDIDAGRPVLMHMGNTLGGGHFVVITGYRRIADHYGFMVHFGWHGKYNPNQAWPLDGWIGRYDLPLYRWVYVGLKPDTTHKRLPLYNKLTELGDSEYEGLTHTSLVWNPDRREYAAVFPAGPVGGQRLYFQRISQAGLPVGDASSVRPTVNCRKPVIAWSGNSYALAWEDRSEKVGTVYFTRIAPDGGQLRDARPVRIGSGADDAWRPSLSLACNGEEFAIAWTDQGQVRFMRISTAGAPLPESQKSIAAGIDPHLVWLGDSYVLAFSGEGAVQLVRLDRGGNMLGRPQKIFPQPNRGTYTPRVCWSGSQFGITWEHIGRNNWHHIGFARADAQCNPIAGSLRMISDFNEPPKYVLWPAISSHNGEFVVTYHRGDAYLTRISAKGEVLENRYLFWAPTCLTHVTNGDVANVLYLHAHAGERIVEVESCLFPLEELASDDTPRSRQVRE